MLKAPSAYTPKTLTALLQQRSAMTEIRQGHWQPARPEGLYSIKSRFRLAWEVFTGRADVLRWPHQ